jgi:anti-sigma-K factor RskA
MKQHHNIQELLYDYVTGTLSAQEKEQVEEHCAACAECRSDLDGIRSVVGTLAPLPPLPSEERSEQFWMQFSDSVDQKISSLTAQSPGVWETFFEELKTFLSGSWKPVGAAAGALAIALIAFLISFTSHRDAVEELLPFVATIQPDTTAERLVQYIRKSKTLLVGLNNLTVEPGEHLDLAAERRTSRQLAMEARALRMHPLDPKSTQLVGDLERLFIELGSADDQRQGPVLSIVRNGMEQKNILFKLRMAETAYGASQVMLTGARR